MLPGMNAMARHEDRTNCHAVKIQSYKGGRLLNEVS